jgi:hypothetical protein
VVIVASDGALGEERADARASAWDARAVIEVCVG